MIIIIIMIITLRAWILRCLDVGLWGPGLANGVHSAGTALQAGSLCVRTDGLCQCSCCACELHRSPIPCTVPQPQNPWTHVHSCHRHLHQRHCQEWLRLSSPGQHLG